MNKGLNSIIPTDSEVILGILNNSESVLKRLYLAYFPMVLQLIINNNGNEDDAKDIYQEAIIILYNKVKEGDFESIPNQRALKPNLRRDNFEEFQDDVRCEDLFLTNQRIFF